MENNDRVSSKTAKIRLVKPVSEDGPSTSKHVKRAKLTSKAINKVAVDGRDPKEDEVFTVQSLTRTKGGFAAKCVADGPITAVQELMRTVTSFFASFAVTIDILRR